MNVAITERSIRGPGRRGTRVAACFVALCGAVAARGSGLPFAASKSAAALDPQIDWSQARLIAVQDAGRYKTLDSFARESIQAMYGQEHFPGLSSLASLMELLFHREHYADTPIIYIKDKGLRIDLTTHLPETRRRQILADGYLTPREFADPRVKRRIDELEPRAVMVTAIRRVRNAEFVAEHVDRMLRLVPQPGPDPDAPWHTPRELLANAPEEVFTEAGISRAQALADLPGRIDGISPQQALSILAPWSGLRAAWLRGDAEGVRKNLDRLAEVLPTLADPGVYPQRSQLAAEARYYAMGKFTWGWMLYFVAALVSVWALVTRWRVPWGIALALLAAAAGVHVYGISLRWYILDRIPVANMFEAVVASAWVGIAAALVAELFYRTRVFLVAASATGFLALVLGQFVIPGGGTLTSIMGILDDVMLRIHTVLIISSYALIFLAAVIATVYLFGYYFHTAPTASAMAGLLIFVTGGVLWLATQWAFVDVDVAVNAAGVVKRGNVAPVLWVAAGVMVLALLAMAKMRLPVVDRVGVGLGGLACATLAIGSQGFCEGMAYALLGGGGLWALLNGVGLLWGRGLLLERPAPALVLSAGTVGFAPPAQLVAQRPVMAGGAPGDEGLAEKLPAWLQHMDWSHLIVLNLVFVMLFAGVILGAVWADYSWGRPWGWDPKEVFALNTWIIYAILIHARFIARLKGLWTAWLSVAGCLMMAFNWCFVNFYIVGLHSYA